MAAIGGMGSNSVQSYWDAQRPSVEERFKKLDQDSDGKVTKAEFKSAADFLAALTGQAPPEGAVDARFAKLDGNGDGGVTLDELKAAWDGKRHGLEARFHTLDGNGDGNLTRPEFDKALEMLMALTGRKVDGGTADDIFKKLDGNGDGQVSLDEFVAALGKGDGPDGGKGIPDRARTAADDRSILARASFAFLSVATESGVRMPEPTGSSWIPFVPSCDPVAPSAPLQVAGTPAKPAAPAAHPATAKPKADPVAAKVADALGGAGSTLANAVRGLQDMTRSMLSIFPGGSQDSGGSTGSAGAFGFSGSNYVSMMITAYEAQFTYKG